MDFSIESINKEVYNSEENGVIEQVEQFQNRFGILLPSDYVKIVLESNGLKTCDCYHITIDGKEPLIEFSGLTALKYLPSRIEFYREFESLNNQDVLSNYIPIGDTVSQAAVFIGVNDKNRNKIFYFDPSLSYHIEDITEIAENVVSFFNNKLMPEDEADIWILNKIRGKENKY